MSEKDSFGSHLPVLEMVLKNTDGAVLEIGAGLYSTPFLYEYCKREYRDFISFENNVDWYWKAVEADAEKKAVAFIKDYTLIDEFISPPAVVFIDSAPGEQRKELIAKYRNTAKVVVAHDTEPECDHGYQMNGVLSSFKYRKDFRDGNNPQTTIASNFIDVTAW